MDDGPTQATALRPPSLPGGLLHAVCDANPLPMWIRDEQSRAILAVNERALRYFGYTREQFTPLILVDLLTDAGQAGLWRYRRPDGTSIAMRLETSEIEIDGRAAQIIVAADAQAERVALVEIDRYRDVVDAAAEWLWEADADLRLSFLSPGFAASTKLLPQAFLGRRLEESAGTISNAAQWKAYRTTIEARRPFRNFVIRVAGSGGRAHWLRLGGTPVFEPDGAFAGYRGVGSDVTAEIEIDLVQRKREQRYARFFETAPVWFFENDKNFRLTYVSPNSARILGMTLDDYRGRRFSETPGLIIDPAKIARIQEIQAAQLPYQDFVYARQCPDGSIIWISASAAPMFDDDGSFCGYCGIAQDVTPQVKAEAALRDSERQFRQILEASADFYWEQDAQYRYSYVSSGWEVVIGPAAEAIGTRLVDIPGISVDPEMGKMVLRQMKAKQPYRDFVFSRKTPSGKSLWFKASGSPHFDRDGGFAGYRGAGAEITQQVEAEAAVRLAQRQLNEAVVHVTQPIVVYDSDDRVVAFNQAFTDLHQAPNTNTPVCHGVSFRELADWQMRFGFYAAGPDDAAIDIAMLLDRLQSEAEHTYHLRNDHWMLVVHRRLPGKGRVGLWTDITAIKRAEAERRALERQMYHSQRLEALGTLAGGAAHEINNALTPVVALSKMVVRKLPQGSRERANLDTVIIGAERSRDLVKQILAFSRREGGELTREQVDVGAVLHEALGLMRATLPASIRLDEETMPTPPVTGDPAQLQQVLVNIMTNAAQAIGQAPGRIAVSLRPDGAALRLSIADSGCGMGETTLARIFEPFFTTKPLGEGTGLGLSVAHGIIKTHGGRIDVESQPGRGSRFDIVLPLIPSSTHQMSYMKMISDGIDLKPDS